MTERRPDPGSRPVLVYRWIVFLLAAGFTLRQIVFAADYSDPGGPFRFLTIWALLLSFASASRLLAYSERRSDSEWPILVMVAAIANALTVVMYWRLWLIDPGLVQNDGPLPWWLDGYLHVLGPLLQWIDGLFLHAGFRRPWRAVLPFGLLVALYLGWVELFVGPASRYPIGSVTSGLPYPFLNNMDLAGRATFYGATAALGLVALAVFWGIAAARRKFLGTI